MSFTLCFGFGDVEGVSQTMGTVCQSDLEILTLEDFGDQVFLSIQDRR